MMKRVAGTMLIVAVAISANALAGESKPWLKPYTEWSAKDVELILSNSPWATTQELAQPATFGAKGGAPKGYLVCRLLSALPVRQALFRSTELNPKANEAQIDAARKLMESKYEDAIVVSVSYYSLAPANRVFARFTSALLRNDTYLTLAGLRRLFLKEFQSPADDGLGAKFVFPRLVDGKPLIGPGERTLRFDAERLGIRNIQFKVADMILNGVLVY